MGTKKMCAGEGVMDQEARYLEVLALVRSFRMDATSLEMLDQEGSRQLHFARAEE
jgi:heat shock protein HslJ